MSTLFPHTTTTAVHLPTAANALGKPTFGPTGGQGHYLRSIPPPSQLFSQVSLCHISSSTASNHGDDKLGGPMREMKRRGKGGQRAGSEGRYDNDKAVCIPHTALSFLFLFSLL